MKRVMRVQWFEMQKYIGYKLLLLGGGAFILTLVYEVMRADYMEPVVAYYLLEIFRLSMFIQVLIMDLTLNLDNRNGVVMQDLLAGVNRKQLLNGKVIFGNCVALILEIVYTLFAVIIVAVTCGIMIEEIRSLLIRFFLLLLLHFRVAGEVILASVLIKKPFVVSIVYTVAFLMTRHNEMELQGTWISEVSVNSLLDSISSYQVKTVYATEGGIIDVLQYLPTTKEIMIASMGSILIGGICFLIAVRIYEKREY